MTNSERIQVHILGCGSSGGVPRITGDWGICDPSEPKNRRTRCSILVSKWNGISLEPTRILIDTSPDLREQLLAAEVSRIDAVLYTHDHADQTHGIDDLRAIAYKNKIRLPVYMDEPSAKSLMTRFAYCFHGGNGYPSIFDAKTELHPGRSISIEGPGGVLNFLALDQAHGRIRSLGFRVGSIAYCNDTVGLPEETLNALQGIDTFIVDALRYEEHPSHAHLDMALGWIDRIKPKRAILTNMHIDMDYQTLLKELPTNVRPAYDGMILDEVYTKA